jgi:hypothetical protein
MDEERRGAARFELPEGIYATVSGLAVRILDLSAIGARIEHEERLPLAAPQLQIAWREAVAILPVKIARAEIAGRRGSQLIYQSGVRFISKDAQAEAVIASILGWADATPAPENAPAAQAEEVTPAATAPASQPAVPPMERLSLDDSWTRQVRFFKDDLEEHLPYAQFRLSATGWEKNYVASPEQPEDGFTIARNELNFAELQKTFELADPETRRMMQIALESKLAATREP